MIQKEKSETSWVVLAGSYLEKGITYDRNGNIKTLQRTANVTVEDNFVYDYAGNQLTVLTKSIQTIPTVMFTRQEVLSQGESCL
ncbi:hypothetical protein [Butyricimonas sp. Marseille-P3923]|uniref:hypothetical protein n=1 Tax=Butyricimonas sp. Marseille-P3923 TaxID=1987504 RepID=UPI000C07A6C5|nr:hypothetical protein [Butyricimonas sp. Marseille-P3923]